MFLFIFIWFGCPSPLISCHDDWKKRQKNAKTKNPKNALTSSKCRQRRLRMCGPSRRTAVRCGSCGVRRRWTSRTATFPTTSCITWRPAGRTRRPLRWCSRVRCRTGRNSNWRSSRNGPSTAFGSWPAPWSETALRPSPSPFELKKMVRISFSIPGQLQVIILSLSPYLLRRRLSSFASCLSLF